jgi:hypothetical protein
VRAGSAVIKMVLTQVTVPLEKNVVSMRVLNCICSDKQNFRIVAFFRGIMNTISTDIQYSDTDE